MSWNEPYEQKPEYIALTPLELRTLKVDIRTRANLEHVFDDTTDCKHKDEIILPKHHGATKVLRLGDSDRDLEHQFSAATEYEDVLNARNSFYIPAGTNVKGYIRLKTTNVTFSGSPMAGNAIPTAEVRNGGDNTELENDIWILPLATSIPKSGVIVDVYPSFKGLYFNYFGLREFRFSGVSFPDGRLKSVRLIAYGRHIVPAECPNLYGSIVIDGTTIMPPTKVGFLTTADWVFGPWYDVESYEWDVSVLNQADSYFVADVRHVAFGGSINLQSARMQAQYYPAAYLQYHISLINNSNSEIIVSSAGIESWDSDWVWIPIQTAVSSQTGLTPTKVRIYKDNVAAVNGTIHVKELVLYATG